MVMFPGAVVVLMLAAGSGDEGRGSAWPEDAALEPGARERPRLHAEASFAGGVALASPAFGLGPGVHLELGVVVADKAILSARASIATIVVVGFFQLGLSGAFAMTERIQLGLGAAWTANTGFVPDLPGAISVQFPLRLAFLTRDRSPSEKARTGLQLGVEAAPGVAYRISGGYHWGLVPISTPAFSFTGMLTIGYAVW